MLTETHWYLSTNYNSGGVKYGKMCFLIAGYNTITDKKKADYDIEGISGIFGNSFIGMALFMIPGLLISEVFEIIDEIRQK